MTSTNTENTRDLTALMHAAREGVRTSLLAALGAGSLASQAVADAVAKAKERVNTSSEAARKNIEDLPSEWAHLRDRLDPAELRRLLDESAKAATTWYQELVSSGERTWEHAVEPQVKRGVEQFEEALRTAQERVDEATSDARERVDHVVAMLTRRAQEAEETVDAVATGRTDEAPGPVKAEAERVATARGRSAGKGTDSGAPESPTRSQRSAKAASARKKAMKPDAGSATSSAKPRRTSREPGSTDKA
jgi:heparin binding hemagglutinin HbhA